MLVVAIYWVIQGEWNNRIFCNVVHFFEQVVSSMRDMLFLWTYLLHDSVQSHFGPPSRGVNEPNLSKPV